VALSAQSLDFTATGTEPNGQIVSVTADLTLAAVDPNEFLITGATGTVTDPYGNTESITGVATGYVDPFGYDNLVFLNGVTGAPTFSATGGPFYFDTCCGPVFTTSVPGYDFGIGPDEYFGNGQYQFVDNGFIAYSGYPPLANPYNDTNVSTNFTVVPEGSSVSILILCGFGLAGGFFFKARQSRLLFKF
jgi:hypothetical protein